MKVCSFEGCERKAVAKGLCFSHRRQQKEGKELTPIRQRKRPSTARHGCLFEGCSRPHKAKGLCEVHYRQNRLGKELAPIHVAGLPCSVEGCYRTKYCKDYCRRHYARWKKYGSPAAVAPKNYSKIEEAEDHLVVHLTGKQGKGRVALVDKEDRHLVENQFVHCGDGYARISRGTHNIISLGRLILGLEKGGLWVDHINGDTLDNRRSNLRAVTRKQNAQNLKPMGEIPLMGVVWDSRRMSFVVTPTRDKVGRFLRSHDAWEASKTHRAQTQEGFVPERYSFPDELFAELDAEAVENRLRNLNQTFRRYLKKWELDDDYEVRIVRKEEP